jgi:sugar-specific transcriptional regulator TrmB
VLQRLIEKGLVSFIVIDKKKYFQAVNPEKFLDNLNEEKQALEIKEKELEKLVNELNAIPKSNTKSNVVVLSGKQGIKVLMQDLLKVKEFLVLGGLIRFVDIFPIYARQWGLEREKKNIRARILLNKPVVKPWKLNVCKQLPKELSFPNPTLIYKDKIAIILYDDDIKVIFIESPKTYTSYKSYFEILWKKAK